MIYVNGRPAIEGPATVRDVLLGADIDPETPGIAVAVGAEIARRAAWPTHEVADGERVEVVTATQGG